MVRGRKQVKLSPLVLQILRFADSDGVASLPELLDSLYAHSGIESPDSFLAAAERALRTCTRLGYLSLERVSHGERMWFTVQEWEALSLGDLVWWNREVGRWDGRWSELQIDGLLIQITRGAVEDLALVDEQPRRGL